MNKQNDMNDTPEERPVTLNHSGEPALPGTAAMPKTASLRRIAANKANAQKSTGPRTPGGRAVSRRNALKTGLCSGQVLVRGWHLKESGVELAALFDQFQQSLNPVGPMEQMLVGQIVSTLWRLRRVLRAESGEIALSVDGGRWERSRRLPRMAWCEPEAQFGPATDPVSEMKASVWGNSLMADWLNAVRERVEQTGELTKTDIKIPFFGHPNTLSNELERLRLVLTRKSDQPDPASQREANKQQALRAIDLKLERIQLRQADCQKREAAEEAAREAADVLPKPEVLDKILRYETTLQRHLYRAMSQLERLQRMRLGEAVPAPLMMEMSEKA